MAFTHYQTFKACESGNHDDCAFKNTSVGWLFICSCKCHRVKGDDPAGDKPEIPPDLQPTKWVHCGMCGGRFEVREDEADYGDGWVCPACVTGEIGP